MLNAVAVFERSLMESRNQNALFHYIKTLRIPFDVDDLLRGQIVTSVAAFDKLIHDLIRIGLVEIFTGGRLPTPKYQAESIDMQTHEAIKSALLPPAEFVFEQAVIRKLSRFSYQDPVKVSEGLSLIWDEKQKWDRIGTLIGKTAKNAQTELKLIAQRRNAIVHESDMDPVTNAKTSISSRDANDVSDFLQACGKAIHSFL